MSHSSINVDLRELLTKQTDSDFLSNFTALSLSLGSVIVNLTLVVISVNRVIRSTLSNLPTDSQ